MTADPSTSTRRWPFSAAATFVGLMWIAYGWSIWAAEGTDPDSRGMWFGSLTSVGYYVTGSLDTVAVVQDREWERLVSSIFLHVGFVHIIMNSAAILQLGRILEAFTTRGRCWLTLLVSGLAGSLVTVIWARVTGTPNDAAGASGAGCGLGTALIILSRGITPLAEFRKQMITWVVVMLAFGLVPMISGTGHAGGAIGGAIAGVVIGRRGSVRLASDRYSKALDVITAVLTLAVVAGLAITALRVPERKAGVAAVDALLEDVYVWLDAGAIPPDVGEWIARAKRVDLFTRPAGEREEIIAVVRSLNRPTGGKISSDAADDARADLVELQYYRGR